MIGHTKIERKSRPNSNGLSTQPASLFIMRREVAIRGDSGIGELLRSKDSETSFGRGKRSTMIDPLSPQSNSSTVLFVNETSVYNKTSS